MRTMTLWTRSLLTELRKEKTFIDLKDYMYFNDRHISGSTFLGVFTVVALDPCRSELKLMRKMM